MINATIITIGDEILVGQTIDTNSAWIATRLRLIGIPVTEIISISDKAEIITEALNRHMQKADLIFITGGLGPTQDDITKKTLSDYFQDTLELNPKILAKVEAMFNAANRPMLEMNRQQALLPKSAVIVENDMGTASGMLFSKNGRMVISLPGVPYEMKGLLMKIIPLIQSKYPLPEFYHNTILFQGIGESQLADSIQETEENCRKKALSVAYLPSPGIVKLRLTGSLNQKEEIDTTLLEIQRKFPDHVFGFENDSLELVIGQLLKKLNKSVSTVESCTGGAIAARIVSIPGSSEYFKGSVVAYANEIKENMVGVSASIIKQFGAVSEQTIEEMASKGRDLLRTDYCIASSGIAGPEGGTEDKPVGTVWIAIASDNGVVSKNFLFKHNRDRNIELTVVYALNFLRRTLIHNLENQPTKV